MIESQGIKTFELPFLDALGTTLRALVCPLTTSSVSLTLTKSLIGVQLRLSPLEGNFLGFLFITIYFKITLFKQKAIVGIRIQGIFNKQSKKTFFFWINLYAQQPLIKLYIIDIQFLNKFLHRRRASQKLNCCIFCNSSNWSLKKSKIVTDSQTHRS